MINMPFSIREPLPQFRLHAIKRLCPDPNGKIEQIVPDDQFAFVLVMEGEAMLNIGDQPFCGVAGRYALMQPGEILWGVLDNQRALCCEVVCFSESPPHDQTLSWLRRFYGAETSGFRGVVTDLMAVAPLLAALQQLREPTSLPAALQAQGCFQQLLALFLAKYEDSDGEACEGYEDQAAIGRALTYIEQNYHLPLTVMELAETVELSRRQFSARFRQMTGARPLDYVNQVRMERAKHLLRHTALPIHEIALQVGFDDPYYFSRRFGQVTGVSPSVYAKREPLLPVTSWCVRIYPYLMFTSQVENIVYYDGNTLGDMLALGVKPTGADGRYWAKGHNWTVYPELLTGIRDVGYPPNAALLRAIKPQLIVNGLWQEPADVERLAQVAPTITINREATLAERMRTIGDIVGKPREAEDWLERYYGKTEQMWDLLRANVQPGESAIVLTFAYGRSLYLMGRGLPHSLYQPRGFTVPATVQRDVYQKKLPFVQIEPEALASYDADHIFLSVPANPESQRAALELRGSQHWTALTAVRERRVHVLDGKWLLFDAITMERMTGYLPELLQMGG